MTTDEEKILTLLKDATPQEPVSFDTLAEAMKATLTAFGLNLVLDSLYGSAKINRCKVTRDGCTELMLWPTGSLSKQSFRPYQAPGATPTRNTTPFRKKDKFMKPVTGKARIMLEILIKQGYATSKELCAAAGTTAVKSFLPSYFERGLLLAEKSENGAVYRVAPGVTAEELLRQKPTEPVDPQIAEPASSAPTEVTDPPSATPIQIDVDPLQDAKQSFKTVRAAISEAEAERRFRIARTSDETLLLFGLDIEPIELDPDETQLLVRFVTAWRGNRTGA